MSEMTGAAQLPQETRETGKAEVPLLPFVLKYWLPHLRAIIMAVLTMLAATLLSITLPLCAKEVATYDGSVVAPADVRMPTPTRILEGGSTAGLTDLTNLLGCTAEALFGGVVDALRPVIPWLQEVQTSAASTSSTSAAVAGTGDDAVFMRGLLCRCLLMAVFVAGYHLVSLAAHLAAYRAGMASQCSIVEGAVRQVLSHSRPERIAVVDPTRLTHVILSSAKASCDTLGALLTDVTANIFASVGTLLVLLLISTRLTIIIAGLVAAVQGVYLAAGKKHDMHSARVTAQGAGLTSFVNNVIRRSETVFVFRCQEFLLGRLTETLDLYKRLTDALNLSIHGYAALSTGSTTLIFVVVLGMCNYLHRRGEITISDIALYFMFLQSFVNRVVMLSTDLSRAWATLGSMRTLQKALAWLVGEEEGLPALRSATEPVVVLQADEKRPRPPSTVRDGNPRAAVELSEVTFAYPVVPSFLTEDNTEGGERFLRGGSDGLPTATEAETAEAAVGGRVSGIRDMSLRVEPGTITALYGPSGVGKSTCLRLFAGLVEPQCGVVRTHERVLLLEQAHAIFLGTAAENIALCDLSGAKPAAEADVQARLSRAIHGSGCSAFLRDPFRARIDNVDNPPFSGGQLQRLCLARVLAGRGGNGAACSLILLDEPTTGLDAQTVTQLLVTIAELRDVHGMTVIISTHDDRVASIADRVINLGRP